MDVTKTFQAMHRDSACGMEVGVCIQYRTTTDWSWVMIRYPVDINDTTPTETVKDFKSSKWPEIIEWVRGYLAEHPEDGFWFA